jgi:hypothetical protein
MVRNVLSLISVDFKSNNPEVTILDSTQRFWETHSTATACDGQNSHKPQQLISTHPIALNYIVYPSIQIRNKMKGMLDPRFSWQ